MVATFVDLRRRPGEILAALQRGEAVTLSRRGRIVGEIVPPRKKTSARVQDHPAFGMWRDVPEMQDPVEYVRTLRKGRYSDL